MGNLKAIIFDVDGTLANTERDGHRVAFNKAFEQTGLDWHWDENLYGELLAVTGGKERIKYYIESHDVKMDTDDIEGFAANLHKLKTKYYLELLKKGAIPLRDGVTTLLAEAKEKGITIAIATTTTPENVTVLLENQLGVESIAWFASIGAGDIVPHKKPAPDIYTHVLNELGLSADECVAVEDSKNGVLSAKAAGLKTLVTTNAYTVNEDLTGADIIVDGLGNAETPFVVQVGNVHGHGYVNVDLLEKMLG